MSQNSRHIDAVRQEDYSELLRLLYNMRRGVKNHALLSEYLLQEFSSYPERLTKFIGIIKTELKNPESEKREKMARRYLHVFSYLCERFGLYEEKLELDDLCFAITKPREYKRLKNALDAYQEKSEKIIEEVYNVLWDKLKRNHIEAEILWRYKNILSIYKKCQKKDIQDVFSLSDIFAFRIIINGTIEDCFEALNILHDSFTPVPRRYKDYVSIPKINGYQSIHTGLIGLIPDFDLIAEIQIRTRFMHDIAEGGIAAHFLYSSDKKSKMITDKERKLLSHMEYVTETIQKNPFIYCLTPMWDIIRLRRGSTIKDFAEKVHSWLAKKARIAVVNKQNQSLNYQIQNFDSIKIITK